EDELDQGSRLPKGVTADMIDFVIITHAHIDHSGYLPRLIKDGFKGFAYTHPATLDLLKILLPDSGRIQEEDVWEENGELIAAARKQGKWAKLNEPLYTLKDSRIALKRIKLIDYDRPVRFAGDVEVLFTEAQHILGSAVVTITVGSGADKRVICFNGNIGRDSMSLLRPLKPVKKADVLIAESTYGNVLHDKRDRLEVLSGIINRAYDRAKTSHPKYGCGVIVIPAFAIGRVQALIYDLRTLMEHKRIPEIPVFLDSPMASKATRVYRKWTKLYNTEAAALVARGIDPISTPVFAECKKSVHSKALDGKNNQPIIIIGSAGMATGGRIRGHIQARLPGKQNTILFVGHQEPGVLGHTLTSEHPETVKFDNDVVRVNATIEMMTDYSGHADYEDSIAWLRNFAQPPAVTFLVHGEPQGLTGFRQHIEETLGWKNVTIPKHRQAFDIN
ncbi:MAG: MBL fold metallo-hydrolase RNA specificity domain-containing protein, partial [Terriglobales bacterium]